MYKNTQADRPGTSTLPRPACRFVSAISHNSDRPPEHKHQQTPLSPPLSNPACSFRHPDDRSDRSSMATLESPSHSPSPARMSRKWARKCERYCCLGATYFPLLFVYSLTSWAVWVEATIGFLPGQPDYLGMNLWSIASRSRLQEDRNRIEFPRNRLLRSPQLVIHDSRLHQPGNDHES
jgi:hypothetical protein